VLLLLLLWMVERRVLEDGSGRTRAVAAGADQHLQNRSSPSPPSSSASSYFPSQPLTPPLYLGTNINTSIPSPPTLTPLPPPQLPPRARHADSTLSSRSSSLPVAVENGPTSHPPNPKVVQHQVRQEQGRQDPWRQACCPQLEEGRYRPQVWYVPSPSSLPSALALESSS
jgi:hypothetical protein